MPAFSFFPLVPADTSPAEAVRRCQWLEHRLREALADRAKIPPSQVTGRGMAGLMITRHVNDLRWWRKRLAG